MRLKDPSPPGTERRRHLPAWLLVVLGGLSVLGVLLLVLVGFAVWGVLWVGKPAKELRPYLEALVERDYPAAHALRCAADREAEPVEALERRFEADPLTRFSMGSTVGRSSGQDERYEDVGTADVELVHASGRTDRVTVTLVEEDGRWRPCEAAGATVPDDDSAGSDRRDGQTRPSTARASSTATSGSAVAGEP